MKAISWVYTFLKASLLYCLHFYQGNKVCDMILANENLFQILINASSLYCLHFYQGNKVWNIILANENLFQTLINTRGYWGLVTRDYRPTVSTQTLEQHTIEKYCLQHQLYIHLLTTMLCLDLDFVWGVSSSSLFCYVSRVWLLWISWIVLEEHKALCIAGWNQKVWK